MGLFIFFMVLSPSGYFFILPERLFRSDFTCEQRKTQDGTLWLFIIILADIILDLCAETQIKISD